MGNVRSKVQNYEEDITYEPFEWKELKFTSFEKEYLRVLVSRLSGFHIDKLKGGLRFDLCEREGIKIYCIDSKEIMLLDFPKKNSYLELFDYEQKLLFKLIRVMKNRNKNNLLL